MQLTHLRLQGYERLLEQLGSEFDQDFPLGWMTIPKSRLSKEDDGETENDHFSFSQTIEGVREKITQYEKILEELKESSNTA